MPELEILEARVPVRTLVQVRETETASARLGPVAGWLNGPVFSRARDIFAANMADLLDRAEDPARMIRMIILEMEETLVEVRATAARSIADIKEMRRAVNRLDELRADWTAKAELALSKGRDDLAKAALIEIQKAAEMADSLGDAAIYLGPFPSNIEARRKIRALGLDLVGFKSSVRQGRQLIVAEKVGSLTQHYMQHLDGKLANFDFRVLIAP